MTRGQKGALVISVAIALIIAFGVMKTYSPRSIPSVTLIGAVLRQDSDPRKQAPIENVEVTAISSLATAECKSDFSGYFHLTLNPGVQPGEPVTLTFRHPGYEPLEMTEPYAERIYVARMTSIPMSEQREQTAAGPESPEVVIKDVRLRYSVKTISTVNIGSIAQPFDVMGAGGVPCRGHTPCSPDGKWKAVLASTTLDAGERSEFQDVRVSCIAGPCSFTKLLPEEHSNEGRTLKVSVLNWSDRVTFLIEAQVTLTRRIDLVRQSYPVKFGAGINFSLPAGAEGPSLEAEVNGSDIVFPLGPDLNLSWASCRVKPDANGSNLYRCELKPGYRF
jgi:hypothetical protein